MTGEPGNQPVTESDPPRGVRIMHDTSMEYFEPYVNNTKSVSLLREYLTYEVNNDCRRERITAVNQRINELQSAD